MGERAGRFIERKYAGVSGARLRCLSGKISKLNRFLDPEITTMSCKSVIGISWTSSFPARPASGNPPRICIRQSRKQGRKVWRHVMLAKMNARCLPRELKIPLSHGKSGFLIWQLEYFGLSVCYLKTDIKCHINKGSRKLEIQCA